MSRNFSPCIHLLLHVAQTRNLELRGFGWLACDHTVSGRPEPRPLSLQMAREENPREDGTPTLVAEGEGLSLGDAVECWNKPDLPRTSREKMGFVLFIVPDCAKTLVSRRHRDLQTLPSWAAGSLLHHCQGGGDTTVSSD